MPRRRFNLPRELLRAWQGHSHTIAGLDKLRDEAMAEKTTLLADVVELLRHFPHGLICDGVLYKLSRKGAVKVRPAPADALDIDGWPDDGPGADGEAVAPKPLSAPVFDAHPIAADH